MQGERVTPPCDILPAAEVGEQVRCARLAHQREIVEGQLLEAATKADPHERVLRADLRCTNGVRACP